MRGAFYIHIHITIARAFNTIVAQIYNTQKLNDRGRRYTCALSKRYKIKNIFERTMRGDTLRGGGGGERARKIK